MSRLTCLRDISWKSEGFQDQNNVIDETLQLHANTQNDLIKGVPPKRFKFRILQ